jgi:nucleotide-binding universal stress UspA family protein
MKNILLAYDGGEPAKRALEIAMDLTKRFEANLSVVSVVPIHPGRSPVDPWDDRSVHAQELLEARRSLAENGIEAEMIEPAGDPAKEIERIATAGKFDTIVIGTRGLGTLNRVLQGSVSEHVAKNAEATVIVAR